MFTYIAMCSHVSLYSNGFCYIYHPTDANLFRFKYPIILLYSHSRHFEHYVVCYCGRPATILKLDRQMACWGGQRLADLAKKLYDELETICLDVWQLVNRIVLGSSLILDQCAATLAIVPLALSFSCVCAVSVK